jgi:hypothetical protein
VLLACCCEENIPLTCLITSAAHITACRLLSTLSSSASNVFSRTNSLRGFHQLSCSGPVRCQPRALPHIPGPCPPQLSLPAALLRAEHQTPPVQPSARKGPRCRMPAAQRGPVQRVHNPAGRRSPDGMGQQVHRPCKQNLLRPRPAQPYAVVRRPLLPWGL